MKSIFKEYSWITSKQFYEIKYFDIGQLVRIEMLKDFVKEIEFNRRKNYVFKFNKKYYMNTIPSQLYIPTIKRTISKTFK